MSRADDILAQMRAKQEADRFAREAQAAQDHSLDDLVPAAPGIGSPYM